MMLSWDSFHLSDILSNGKLFIIYIIDILLYIIGVGVLKVWPSLYEFWGYLNLIIH
jgi:hypothetical protein